MKAYYFFGLPLSCFGICRVLGFSWEQRYLETLNHVRHRREAVDATDLCLQILREWTSLEPEK
jgi:hypothetical protein